ncbi:MAG: methyltransferase [Terracoccus sp.]
MTPPTSERRPGPRDWTSLADAADRLLLDESGAARGDLHDGSLVVIGDVAGALTLGAASEGARGIRVHQDPLTAERTLRTQAERLGHADAFASHGLEASLVDGARVVLLRLPRSLDELRDSAGLIAAHAHPEVVVFAGGRIKHMTTTMNDVLREVFERVDVTHARQKSRVLVARRPSSGGDPQPRTEDHPGLLTVRALGGVFAGTSIDIGTRFLLEHLPEELPDEVVDLACGTGVVATVLALRHAGIRVHASDESAAAVASARATAAANGVADRVSVVRDDALSSLPSGSARFIALNPPFHSGSSVDESIAPHLFADAARVLEPGGELWTVWNSHLLHRPLLSLLVGPTRQVARNAKFVVTASIAR